MLERISDIADGLGVNYSVDTTGVSQVIESSIKVLATGGESESVAMADKLTEIHTTHELVLGVHEIHGVNLGNAVAQLAVPNLVEYFEASKFPFDRDKGIEAAYKNE